jgi:hypothetical protein
MGPEFWKPDKPSRLKKCSEFVSPACNPVATEGCCAVIPCSYCLTWDPYTGSTVYGTAEWNGTGWTGTIAGRAFVGFWEVGYESGECEFVVTLSGTEIYRVDCYGGQSCRDSSDSVATTIAEITGTLTWTKILHRPLEYEIDADTYCVRHFCGSCECSCLTLCATIIGADCCETRFLMSDVSYPCDGPEWYGSGMCGVTPYEATIRLTRRDYDGACILSGSVNGAELDEVELTACIGWTYTWTLYGGDVITVVCDDCDCDTTVACATGCCWPTETSDLYPCGYRIAIPFEISAPGCDIDGLADVFPATGVGIAGPCGGCDPIGSGSDTPTATLGSINVEGPGSYCMDTPCNMDIELRLVCEDGASVYGLDECCGGFRLWVGTSVRMVGWDGTAPSGGSSLLYWIKFAPTSCSCDPIAMIFEVSLVADCPEVWVGGGCDGLPKACCEPFCSAFTVTI